MSLLIDLPVELLEKISEYIKIQDIKMWRYTSKYFYYAIKEDWHWKQKCQKKIRNFSPRFCPYRAIYNYASRATLFCRNIVLSCSTGQNIICTCRLTQTQHLLISVQTEILNRNQWSIINTDEIYIYYSGKLIRFDTKICLSQSSAKSWHILGTSTDNQKFRINISFIPGDWQPKIKTELV